MWRCTMRGAGQAVDKACASYSTDARDKFHPEQVFLVGLRCAPIASGNAWTDSGIP